MGKYREEINIFYPVHCGSKMHKKKNIFTVKFIMTDIHCSPGLFPSFNEDSSIWLSVFFSSLYMSSFSVTSLENRSNQTRLNHSSSTKTTKKFASIATMEVSLMLLSIYVCFALHLFLNTQGFYVQYFSTSLSWVTNYNLSLY